MRGVAAINQCGAVETPHLLHSYLDAWMTQRARQSTHCFTLPVPAERNNLNLCLSTMVKVRYVPPYSVLLACNNSSKPVDTDVMEASRLPSIAIPRHIMMGLLPASSKDFTISAAARVSRVIDGASVPAGGRPNGPGRSLPERFYFKFASDRPFPVIVIWSLVTDSNR